MKNDGTPFTEGRSFAQNAVSRIADDCANDQRKVASLLGSRPRPSEVFTPRSHDLNQRTYAERPTLEGRLKRALGGHKYVILHGESGNGKTWLYKRVLSNMNMPFQVVNLAKMNIEKSLNAVLAQQLGKLGAEAQVGQSQEVDAGFKPGGMGAAYKHSFEYKSHPIGMLESLAIEMNKKYGNKPSLLVLDNFEQIIENEQFVREVASLIISADEEFVSKSNIKVMIVGTPYNIKHMISKVSNANTIANRFVEIPEVARLELAESRHIMSQGFEKHLRYTMLVDRNELYKSISYKTDRIAQHVQEYCLKVAEYAKEANETISDKIVELAEKEWLEETLSADVASVEDLMNSQETKVGRKNQVMFCLGLVQSEDFRHVEIENLVRSTFSVSNQIGLNIPQILSEFATAANPIIRKTGKAGKYRFCSPKTRMVIRSKLIIASDGRVTKR